jgi:histidyl-tRNA synthetase
MSSETGKRSSPIQAVRGTRDILPDEVAAWHRIEAEAQRLFGRHGYREIRTPVFEATELFARGIGDETDIVAKEMYTFDDRDGASITLRPEATAGIVRSVIERNLMNTDPALKVYALGPMFRRERPQKGRYRQFHQVDVEAFGIVEPTIDVEIIALAMDYLRACGVADAALVLNSVGDAACRPRYVEALRAALREKASSLCADCQRRAETNPLRVLDCKVAEDQAAIDGLPRIQDHLCEPCRSHFDAVRAGLDVVGIPYDISHRLVRGLDYYTRTTFEVVSGALGAQNSVLGGGRYDGLVRDLGGPELCGIGFALGMERLVMMLGEAPPEPRCSVLVAAPRKGGAEGAPASAFEPIAAAVLRLHRSLAEAGVAVLLEHNRRSFKATLKLADKLGARFVALRGEDEEKRAAWTLRDMAASSQEELPEDRAHAYLLEKLGKESAHG